MCGWNLTKEISGFCLYTATVDDVTVKVHIFFAASMMYITIIVDTHNTFQNCFAKKGKPGYVTLLSCFLEWLREEYFVYDNKQTEPLGNYKVLLSLRRDNKHTISCVEEATVVEHDSICVALTDF